MREAVSGQVAGLKKACGFIAHVALRARVSASARVPRKSPGALASKHGEVKILECSMHVPDPTEKSLDSSVRNVPSLIKLNFFLFLPSQTEKFEDS